MAVKVPHVEDPSLRVRVMRYYMAIFCFLFLVLGVGVIACSAVLISERNASCGFIDDYYAGVYMLLGAGCATAFFSVLACVHNQRSTSAKDFLPLVVVAIIVLVLQVFAAISGQILNNMAEDEKLASDMETEWGGYYYTENAACVDVLQSQFRCCGVHNRSDWFTRSEAAGSSVPYPSSCQCSNTSRMCVQSTEVYNNTFVSTSVYSRPCLKKVVDDLHNTLLVPRIVGPVLSLVEAVFFLAACYFLHQVHNRSLVGVYMAKPPGLDVVTTGVRDSPSCSHWTMVSDNNNVPIASTDVTTNSQESLSVSRNVTTVHL